MPRLEAANGCQPAVATPAPLQDGRDEMFALMLADIDGRLDAIEQRTDRLVAQAA